MFHQLKITPMNVSFNFRRLYPVVAPAIFVFLFACGSNSGPAGTSQLHLLTGGDSKTWRMTLDTSYTGMASNECLMDNRYIFKASGEFLNIDEGTPCSKGAEGARLSLKWALDSDSTTLTFNGSSAMHIASLTDSMMVVEELSRADNSVVRKTVFRVEKN